MSYKYPFKSHKAAVLPKGEQGVDYDFWLAPSVDLAALWGDVAGPIIEIGGPSDLGYYFLNDITLTTKPVITNISRNPAPYAHEAKRLAAMIDEIVDGCRMQYDDESVGALLMAHITWIRDDWVERSDEEREQLLPQVERDNAAAAYETARIVAGIEKMEVARVAQYPQILREAARVLRPGGLLLIDGASTETFALMRLLSFETVGLLQDFEAYSNKTGGEVLARKPLRK